MMRLGVAKNVARYGQVTFLAKLICDSAGYW
jgi:hypothetical protein